MDVSSGPSLNCGLERYDKEAFLVSPFLESLARPLLVFHGLLAGATIGLLTHHMVWVWRRDAMLPIRRRQARRFIRLGFIATVLQLGTGLLVYPTYRIRVRLAHFDQLVQGHVPSAWLSQLFDLKEHSGALLFAATTALLLGDLVQDEIQSHRFPALGRTVHRLIALVAAALAWLATVIGLWISSYHGLGQLPP